jgi:hypothetical protein
MAIQREMTAALRGKAAWVLLTGLVAVPSAAVAGPTQPAGADLDGEAMIGEAPEVAEVQSRMEQSRKEQGAKQSVHDRREVDPEEKDEDAEEAPVQLERRRDRQLDLNNESQTKATPRQIRPEKGARPADYR